MRILLTSLVVLLAAGCATTLTGPTSAGNNTWVMSKQAGAFPTGKEPLLADVLTEATSFCANQKKTLKVININENMQPIGNFPKATVLFSCES
jgi:hypothetical protein